MIRLVKGSHCQNEKKKKDSLNEMKKKILKYCPMPFLILKYS